MGFGLSFMYCQKPPSLSCLFFVLLIIASTQMGFKAEGKWVVNFVTKEFKSYLVYLKLFVCVAGRVYLKSFHFSQVSIVFSFFFSAHLGV